MSLIRNAERFARKTIRRIYAARLPYPDWRRLLGSNFSSWKNLRQLDGPSNRVLLATSVGGHVGVATLDSLLALALTLRGASVDVLLCDEVLPACEQCMVVRFAGNEDFIRNGPQRDICSACFPQAEQMFRSLGINVYRYSQFLTPEDFRLAEEATKSLAVEQIAEHVHLGIPVGEHAYAGALRYYARGTLDSEPHGEQVLRRYFRASLLTAAAATRLFKQNNYVSASFHHGIYVPQGIIGAVARKSGVRVVNWMPAYRKKTFIFSHDNTYHHTLMTEPISHWQEIVWTRQAEDDLLNYLRSRWKGSEDWISFNRNPEEDLELIESELKLDKSKPIIGLLTNVVWDAQLHYPANVFPNMIEWLLETIRYFATRPDLQLVVRIHPAELTGHIKSRQPALDEIQRAFPALPGNIFVIPPDSPISTYIVMRKANAVLIYGTKTGVELTSLGIPVIVAGEAWIRNKGITMDPISAIEYFRMLDQLPVADRMSAEMTDRARRYAYHFFFRRMIPLDFMVPAEGVPPYRVQIAGAEDLLPGKDVGLDVICDGIIKGTDFIYPAERLGEAATLPSKSSFVEVTAP
jgi:hypothetical protein